MKAFWNDRYSEEDYAYGTKPNVFFKESLDRFNPKGKILLPAEGEGRNAVYAAKRGLDVYAFDFSQEGRKKALQLAERENVVIHYEVGDAFPLGFVDESFDAAALIYAHFPPPVLSKYHAKVASLMKPGGIVILEGFSKRNLELRAANPQIGGPPNLEMLFSVEGISHDFPNFEVIQLQEEEVELKEGKFHNGIGRVIRFIGRKNG